MVSKNAKQKKVVDLEERLKGSAKEGRQEFSEAYIDGVLRDIRPAIKAAAAFVDGSETLSIGVYGIEGSFTHQAVEHAHAYLPNVRLVFEPNATELAKLAMDRTIDMAVFAVVNSEAGPVGSTMRQFTENPELTVLDSKTLLVDQKTGGYFTNPEDVKYVISHPTALKQCRNNLAEIYPNAIFIEEEDTALAIKYLSEETYFERRDAKQILFERDQQVHNNVTIEDATKANVAVVGPQLAFDIYFRDEAKGINPNLTMARDGMNVADRGPENYTSFQWATAMRGPRLDSLTAMRNYTHLLLPHKG